MSTFGAKPVFGRRNTDGPPPPAPVTIASGSQSAEETGTGQSKGSSGSAMDVIRDQVLLRVEPAVAVRMSQGELSERVTALVSEIATEMKLLLNRQESKVWRTRSSMT
jgi:hypothetical protein